MMRHSAGWWLAVGAFGSLMARCFREDFVVEKLSVGSWKKWQKSGDDDDDDDDEDEEFEKVGKARR